MSLQFEILLMVQLKKKFMQIFINLCSIINCYSWEIDIILLLNNLIFFSFETWLEIFLTDLFDLVTS